jgi:hypothetical protein
MGGVLMNWTLVNEGYIYQVTGCWLTERGYQFTKKVIGYYKTLKEARAACEDPENVKKITSNEIRFIKSKNKFKKEFLTEYNGKRNGSGYFQIVKIEQVK